MTNVYLKAVLAAAIPVVTAVGLWLQNGTLNAPELSLGITGFIAAVLVAILRNQPGTVLEAAKFFAAALTPIVSAVLQYFVTGAWDRTEMTTLIIGLLTSILVYLAANNDSSVNSVGTRGRY